MASILFLLLVAACLLVTLHAQEQVQVQAAVQVTAAKRQVCGTKDPSEAKLQEVRRYLHQHHASNSQLRGTMAEAVEVPVHMWVISDSSGEGDLSDSTIQQQMNILNSKFKDKGFSFTLASTGRRTNDEWFNYMLEDDEVEAEAKQALAVSKLPFPALPIARPSASDLLQLDRTSSMSTRSTSTSTTGWCRSAKGASPGTTALSPPTWMASWSPTPRFRVSLGSTWA